jgi:hypothetical protein
MEMRRKLVMRIRMLGARERAVRRRRIWTEKATSLPELGFLTRRSTRGTRGTVVGKPAVALTLEPEEVGFGLNVGMGVKVCIAVAGDVAEFDDCDGVCCAFAAVGATRVIAIAMAVSLMIFPRDLIASSEFP